MFYVSHLVHRSLILSDTLFLFKEEKIFSIFNQLLQNILCHLFIAQNCSSFKGAFLSETRLVQWPCEKRAWNIQSGRATELFQLGSIIPPASEKSCAMKSFFWPEYEVFLPINCRPKKFTLTSSKALLVRFKITESRSTHHSDSFCEVQRKNSWSDKKYWDKVHNSLGQFCRGSKMTIVRCSYAEHITMRRKAL